MATVIDSLLIELGLDSSKFMASKNKVIDALKEIQEENEKNSIDKKKAAEEEKNKGKRKTKKNTEKMLFLSS